jgi:hypothetical protein
VSRPRRHNESAIIFLARNRTTTKTANQRTIFESFRSTFPQYLDTSSPGGLFPVASSSLSSPTDPTSPSISAEETHILAKSYNTILYCNNRRCPFDGCTDLKGISGTRRRLITHRSICKHNLPNQDIPPRKVKRVRATTKCLEVEHRTRMRIRHIESKLAFGLQPTAGFLKFSCLRSSRLFYASCLLRD